MIYEVAVYTDIVALNTDAAARYEQVRKERSGVSYDRWWTIQSVMPRGERGFAVVWARVAPLKRLN